MNSPTEVYSLPNGLTYIHYELPLEVGRFYIAIRAGAAYDFFGCEGIAHMLEHLVFKGNKRFDQKSFSMFFDQLGEELDAYTTKEYIVFSFTSPANRIAEAVEVLCSVLLQPEFSRKHLSSEKEVITQEIALYEDMPEEKLLDIADQCTFTSPYGHSILGSKHSLHNMQIEDVQAFHRMYFTGSNIYAFSIGSFSTEDRAKIRDILELFPQGEKILRITPVLKHSVEEALKENREQKYYLRYVAFSSIWSREYFCDKILADYLGGSGYSLLFQRLREETPLVYDVEAGVMPCGNVGVFFIRFSADSRTYDEAKNALEELLNAPLDITESILANLIEKFKNKRKLAQTDPFFLSSESMHQFLTAQDESVLEKSLWEDFLVNVSVDDLIKRWKENIKSARRVFELI